MYNEADDMTASWRAVLLTAPARKHCKLPRAYEGTVHDRLATQHAEMDTSRPTCSYRAELYRLCRAFHLILGPGLSTKGVCNMRLADRTTILLSLRKSLRPVLHLQESRTSRRPVPLHQDGHESICSILAMVEPRLRAPA